MFLKSKLAVAFAVTASAVYGGGFWLEFGNPSASHDPAAKEAVLLVRALGCGEPAKARLTATAEGLVDGQRKSIPLEIAPLSTPGVWAVKRAWPQDGAWVLSFTAYEHDRITSAVARVGPKGVESKAERFNGRTPTSAEIEAALHPATTN
jgi:hypothetical protein